MIAVGFVLGFALAAPVFYLLGVFAERDRATKHERADIKAALKRSVR